MHSLTKSAIFFAVGHIAQVKGTQRMAEIRGLTDCAPGARLGPGAGRDRDRRAAADGPVHERVPDRHLDFRARAGCSRSPLGPRPAGGARRAAAAPERPGVRRSRRAQRPGQGFATCRWSLHLALVLVAGIWLPPALVAGSSTSRACWADMDWTPSELVATADGLAQQAAAQPGRRGGSDSLLSLWGEPGRAHMALLELEQGRACGRQPRLRRRRFPFGRPRCIRRRSASSARCSDLVRPEAEGAPDPPAAGCEPRRSRRRIRFLPVEGEGLHQIPVGPVHAGIIEPGHFRFTANGETVVRLEERLGYVHKGIEALMAGATLERAAPLAGAHLRRQHGRLRDRVRAGRRGRARRAGCRRARSGCARSMAELERLANHLGDIGADLQRRVLQHHARAAAACCASVLRAADACFGHRLMMDRVVPGGVRSDLAAQGERAAARHWSPFMRRRFPELVDLTTTRLAQGPHGRHRHPCARAGAAVRRRRLCRARLGARTSTRGARQATRRTTGCGSRCPVQAGDVDARVWIRIREVEQSLALIEQILDGLPAGAIRARCRRGRGRAKAWRWSKASAATSSSGCASAPTAVIERCHLRDPSWFQWPLLEAAIEGNIVADFPLCNKSFNCSYSGHDL